MPLARRTERFVTRASDHITIDQSASHGSPLLANRRKRAARPLNRALIVRKVAQEVGIPLSQAKIVVRAIFDSIVGSLARGEDVEVAKFGRFTTQAATPVDRPDQGGQVPEFVPAKSLRDAVN